MRRAAGLPCGPDVLGISLPEPQASSPQAWPPVQQDDLGSTFRPGQPPPGAGAAPLEILGASLLLEDSSGLVVQSIDLQRGLTRIGRTGGEVLFGGDPYVAPSHAWVVVGRTSVRIRDTGTANGIYLHRTGESFLQDGDALLVGSQLLLFQDRWADREMSQESTKLFGSAGWQNPYRLVNLRQGGDVVHVHILDGDIVIGREGASPYRNDRYLSRQHLAVELTAEGVRVRDLSGGRGYYLRLRGEAPLEDGQSFVLGSRLLRLSIRYKA
jgi:pSer/pThr/pTyr-binding forkhead associated (FHA) protein